MISGKNCEQLYACYQSETDSLQSMHNINGNPGYPFTPIPMSLTLFEGRRFAI